MAENGSGVIDRIEKLLDEPMAENAHPTEPRPDVAPPDSQAEGEPGQVEQVPAEGDPDVALRKVAGIVIGVVLTAFSCLCGGINFDNIRLSDSPFLMAGGVILMLILLGLVLWKLKVIVSMSMDSDRFR